MNTYKVTIKMIKETTMNHQQTIMEKAKRDVERVIENASNEEINEIFNGKKRFIYKVSKL